MGGDCESHLNLFYPNTLICEMVSLLHIVKTASWMGFEDFKMKSLLKWTDTYLEEFKYLLLFPVCFGFDPSKKRLLSPTLRSSNPCCFFLFALVLTQAKRDYYLFTKHVMNNSSEDLKVSILYLITEIQVGLILDSANVEIAKQIWKSHASCHIIL